MTEPQRDDYLQHADERVHFAQLNDPSIRLERKPTVAAAKSINVGILRKSEERQKRKTGACFKSGKEVITNSTSSKKSRRILRWAVADNVDATCQWILDSESNRHLVTTPSQLYNTKECDEECLLPNGESLKMQLKGNADLVVRVDGDLRLIKLSDIY